MENIPENITAEEFLIMVGNLTGQLHNHLLNDSISSTTLSSSSLSTVNSTTTEIIHNNTYPSGYTLTHIVFASIIVTVLMIVIVVGNMLVIIAIATEKSLKNIQNWFIASLAVADFFLGLVIMPFSLANELMGYWIFGSWWCDIHSAMDVLLCTASIMNLCLISLDRYWSITKAVEYLRSRTPARAAVMITAVWIMSGLICIPPLLGWKAKRTEGALPQCQVCISYMDIGISKKWYKSHKSKHNLFISYVIIFVYIFVLSLVHWHISLSEDIGYVLYSALGSFYIPSCIMVFVYIRIYFAAKARARRGIKKKPQKNQEQVTSFTTHTQPMPSGSSSSSQHHHHQQHHLQQQIATIETRQNDSVPIPIVTYDGPSDTSDGDNQNTDSQNAMQVSTIVSAAVTDAAGNSNSTSAPGNDCLTLNSINGKSSMATTSSASCQNQQQSNELKISPTAAGRCRALSVGIDNDMVSEFDPSSSDSGVFSRCAVVKPLKFRLCKPIFGKKTSHHKNLDIKKQKELEPAELEPAIPKIVKPRDPEKEKRRIARKKEKRATLILGLIMGSFIACWLPFFFLYILTPACRQCEIPESAFAVAFWLGYMNSALNPAIYTIFNKDFRRAFRRILFK